MLVTDRRTARSTRRALSRADTALLAAALLLVAWGTLAFGAVYPWAYTPLFAGCTLVGVIAFWRARAVPLSTDVRVALVALTLLGIAAVAQTIPLPAAARTAISPSTEPFLREIDVRYSASVMIREQTGDTTYPVPLRPLSLNPAATLRSVGMLAALTLLLGGLIKLFGRVGAGRLVPWLIALGALLAVIGIVQKALLGDHAWAGMKIYGFWEPRYKLTTPFGPYVNKNHYAGWMIMALPLAIGFLLSMAAGSLRDVRRGWRDRLLWLSSPEGGRAQLVGFAIVLMGLALTLTMSRSGLAALTIALIASVLVGARGQYTVKVRGALAGGLLLLLAGGVIWADVDVAGRFTSRGSSVALRRAAWRDAAAIVRDFPVAGTGLNTYGTATLKYATTRSDLQFYEAHNEYLQIAAEGGLLLGIPAAVALFCCTRELRRRLAAERGDVRAYWLRLGAAMAVVAIALQSLVEFSLQMPGNAAFFVVVLAAALHRPAPDAAALS